MSAEHFAAATGDTGTLRAQIQAAPELVHSAHETGSTPLHYSAANGHRDASEYLLTAGADVNARNAAGATAMDLARVNAHYEIADMLAARSAPPAWLTPAPGSDQPLPGYTQPEFVGGGVWPPPPISQIGPVAQDFFGDAADFLPSMSGGMVTINWVGESFDIFKRDAGVWLLTMVIFGGMLIAIQFLSQLVGALFGLAMPSTGSPTMSTGRIVVIVLLVIVSLVVWVMTTVGQMYLQCGLQRMANAAVRGEPIAISMLFGGLASTPGYLLTTLLIGLCALLGVFACIIGTMVVAAMLLPALTLAADGQPALQSIRRTYTAMKSQWPMALGIYIVMTLIAMVASLPCGLGLLVVGPMVSIMVSLAYRDVIGMPRRTPAPSG